MKPNAARRSREQFQNLDKCLKFLKKMSMIYDCVLFFNEVDLLKVRLEELKDAVDKCLIIESTKTFSGKSKPLFFKRYRKEFRQYEDKIIYHIVHDMPPLNGDFRFALERHQRNAILGVLKSCRCKNDDIILICDADEIIKARAIPRLLRLLNNNESVRFRLKTYKYFLNCPLQHQQLGGAACTYGALKRWSAHHLRFSARWLEYEHKFEGKPKKFKEPQRSILEKAGWHLTFLGGPDAVTYKLKSFSWIDPTFEPQLKKIKVKQNICRSNQHNDKKVSPKSLPYWNIWVHCTQGYRCALIYYAKDFPTYKDLPAYILNNKHEFEHFFKFVDKYNLSSSSYKR